MSTQDSRNKLQEQHLDMMIRMALQQDEDEKTSELVNSSDPELTPEIERSADSAYVRALKKAERDGSVERRKKTVRTIYRAMTSGLKMAAAIALVVVVAMPIAIATSSAFRSTVLKMIMEIDEERNEVSFSFQGNRNVTSNVPDLWKGEYFPLYLPEDVRQSFISKDGMNVEYECDGSKKIAFSEYDEQAELIAGTEGAKIDTIALSDEVTASIIVGDIAGRQNVSVTWSMGDKWFDLTTYGYSREETIQIAESVTRINR